MKINFDTLYDEICEINKSEPKDLATKLMKLEEEKGEMIAELLKFKGETYKKYNKESLTKEMADTLQCLLSIFNQIEKETGIILPEVFDSMKVKNDKWRDKIKDYTKTSSEVLSNYVRPGMYSEDTKLNKKYYNLEDMPCSYFQNFPLPNGFFVLNTSPEGVVIGDMGGNTQYLTNEEYEKLKNKGKII